MELWSELKQMISALEGTGLTTDLAKECLRGIEILEVLGGKEGTFTRFAQCAPAPQDGAEATHRWLSALNGAIQVALKGGRTLVLKTMHLTHGLRELFPFDETTTLQHVEDHLLRCYRDSIHEFITKSTAELLPDGPIRLEFYDGNPREGVEPRPLDPETRVATLPSVETDGVYWWPQSKESLRELDTEEAFLMSGVRSVAMPLPIPAVMRRARRGATLITANEVVWRDTAMALSFWSDGFVDARQALILVEDKRGEEKSSLAALIEQAFRTVLTKVMQGHAASGSITSTEELLDAISFQIIGTVPQQKLVIRCGEEASAIELPTRLDFYEEALMKAADAERDKVMGKGRNSTGYFQGHSHPRGSRFPRPGSGNRPLKPR